MTLPGTKAQQILDRDRAVVSPSYPRAAPFVMDHGLGSEVWDVDGNRFIDLAAGIGVCSTGHSHPQVVKAIKRQADRFLHISCDFYHPIWVELSEKLASIAPYSEPAMVFLGNSGTEAVEAAIKLARHHTGRQGFIGFYGGFHGRTMGSLAFTASKPVLDARGGDYGEAVVRFIEEVMLTTVIPPEDCAGVLVEPILGEGGYVVPTDGFFPALRRLCDKYGILLIADEVQSGVGRTGKWWAIENWGVEPDIVCFAKGIASGIPLGGILARASVMDWPVGAHGTTFGGNPIACSAALATLNLVGDGMMQNAREMGEFAMDSLAEIQSRHKSIGQVRGKGLMLGVEFVIDRESKRPARKLRERIIQKAFSHGLLLLGSGENSIRLAPPLNIERNILDEGLQIMQSAIAEAEAQGID
jgi:4-aminobutyrate aminotransferase